MKLTVNEAYLFVVKARNLQAKTGLRLGQALFAELPAVVCDEHRGKETDFFYWLDDEKVLSCFYENYVESS